MLRRLGCLLALFAFTIGAGPVRAGTLTLFVDGADFGESAAASLGVRGTQLEGMVPWLTGRAGAGPAPDRQTSYLQGSWLGAAIAAEVPGVHRQIAWNGDLTDAANVSRAVTAVESAVLEGSRRGDRVNVVAHSMGSVIAYVALRRLAASGQEGYGGVDEFVTLASPLGSADALAALRSLGASASFVPASPSEVQAAGALRIRGAWLNVYAIDDPLAGPLAAASVRNARVGPCPVPVPAGIAGVCAHALPYLDYATIRRVIAALAGAGAAAGAEHSARDP